jgi:hypothetical protein
MRIFRNLNVHFVIFCVAHYEVNSNNRTFLAGFQTILAPINLLNVLHS